jgi:hypothetical protein
VAAHYDSERGNSPGAHLRVPDPTGAGIRVKPYLDFGVEFRFRVAAIRDACRVEDAHPEVVRDFGEVVFWIGDHD